MAKSLRSRGHKALINVLIEARTTAGLTQKQLAARLGQPQSWISKIELGERRLDVVEFIEVARALKVEPVALFSRVVQW